MEYKKTELGKGIGLTEIIDGKFKTSSISVVFITRLSEETAAANCLAADALSISNSRYKTLAELNTKLSELYGSGIGSFSRKKGDAQILGISASWIIDRCTIDGEKIENEMLGIVRDCLFSPNVKNDAFDVNSFEIIKRDLLDRIDGRLNDKRSYSLHRAIEIAYRNEPAAVPLCGTRETAEKVTPEQAFRAYRKILENAKAEICFVSPEKNPFVAEIFRDAFSKTERNPEEFDFCKRSPVKSQPEEVCETVNVKQSKIVMTWKYSTDDYFAFNIMIAVLDMIPTSKLFRNVREKLSLCYYCSCNVNHAKHSIIIDSGTERRNLEKVKEEVIRQIEEMQNGNVSEDEIESAVLDCENALCSVGDTPSSYSSWYFERYFQKKFASPKDFLDEYRKVTKERVVKAAQTLVLDSVYTMLGKEEQP